MKELNPNTATKTPAKHKEGRPTYVLTHSGWLVNLDDIAAARMHVHEERLNRIELWFRGQDTGAPQMTLMGRDAEDLLQTLTSRSNIRRYFVPEEMAGEE